MIDEIKRMKLEELKKQKEEYYEQKRNIKQNYYKIYDQLFNLKSEQSRGITVRDNFSLLEKLITRRREYKRFKAQSRRFSELPKLISKAESELEEEEKKVKIELEKRGITAKEREIASESGTIMHAKTLSEMGITPIEAMEFLESKGIQPVLSEADKNLTRNPRDYSSKSSLIGVHKGGHAPVNNILSSAKDAGAKLKWKIRINGIEYEYSYKIERDTVHMSMNDEVASHISGSWDGKKYAVLIPFDDIPNEKIGCAETVDTFTKGSIELSEHSWILCPKNEVEKLKKLNPKVHVLGYEGENVQGFSQPFLTQLGYRAEDVGMWYWSDQESCNQFNDLMKKEGIERGHHSYTDFFKSEKALQNINATVSICKLLKENDLIKTPEDIENISKQLEGQSCDFLLCWLGTNEDRKNYTGIFLNEMKKNGFNISPKYLDIIEKLSGRPIENWSKDKDEIFDVSEEVTEEEKKAIDKLQETINHSEYSNTRRKAYEGFIINAMCDSVLNSPKREVLEEKSQEEK